MFGKEHKNVLQDIRNLEYSEEFRLLNFQEAKYMDEIFNNYLYIHCYAHDIGDEILMPTSGHA